MPAQSPAFPPRFKVLRRIGAGGMGVVYEAVDVERGSHVALKTILHRDADALARFKHEFRALQGIHHPNLVELGELLGDAEDVFFTMELVDGVDLLQWIRVESAGKARMPSSPESATVVNAPRGDSSKGGASSRRGAGRGEQRSRERGRHRPRRDDDGAPPASEELVALARVVELVRLVAARRRLR